MNWISVGNALPPIGRIVVIVFTDEEGEQDWDTGVRWEQGFTRVGATSTLESNGNIVTHWLEMELPIIK